MENKDSSEPFAPAGALIAAAKDGAAAIPEGGKPSDSPDFYLLPPPPGRSRESTIELDAFGRFFHEGVLVDHPKLQRAFHTWITRHPDDGRYILTNGYDWTYFTVRDVPFFVRGASSEGLSLEGNLQIPWSSVRKLGERGDDLYAEIEIENKGVFPARFLQEGRLALGPFLEEREGSLGVQRGAHWLPVNAVFSS